MMKMATTLPTDENHWEVRPGGMLVQKRDPDSVSDTAASLHIPTIRVKVKYLDAYHEIYLSSQSTFGELKKLVAERVGLHPQDQKVLFKEKERESTAFLDRSGVKDKSKIVVVADPVAQAKRVAEMRRVARLEKAVKAVDYISKEVDRITSKVSILEGIVSKGKRVADSDISNLIEQLMMQLIKLDSIVAEGDTKLQKGTQVKRVQKYVETLDLLKVKNAKISTYASVPSRPPPQQQQQQHRLQKQPAQSVVVTKEWEMFDSLLVPSNSAATSTSTTSSTTIPRVDWELF